MLRPSTKPADGAPRAADDRRGPRASRSRRPDQLRSQQLRWRLRLLDHLVGGALIVSSDPFFLMPAFHQGLNADLPADQIGGLREATATPNTKRTQPADPDSQRQHRSPRRDQRNPGCAPRQTAEEPDHRHRLLRARRAIRCGVGGAKGGDQGECGPAAHCLQKLPQTRTFLLQYRGTSHVIDEDPQPRARAQPVAAPVWHPSRKKAHGRQRASAMN
jgi:hypothetical protein